MRKIMLKKVSFMVDFVNFKRYNKQTFGKRWDGSVLNIVLVEPATSRAPAPRPVRGCTSSSRSASTFPTAPSSARGWTTGIWSRSAPTKTSPTSLNSTPRPPRTAGSPRPRRRRTTARRNFTTAAGSSSARRPPVCPRTSVWRIMNAASAFPCAPRRAA